MEAQIAALEKTADELETAFANIDTDDLKRLESENRKLEYRLRHLQGAIEQERAAMKNKDYGAELSLLAILKHGFGVAISKAFPGIPEQKVLIIPYKGKGKFDYQCNNVLSLLKVIHEKKSPTQVAQQLIDHLPNNLTDLLQPLDIAGPGFINVNYKTAVIAKRLIQGFQHKFAAKARPTKKRLVIDYSSPNIAKDMHVGHLRSTIIGDALGNLYDYLGYDVVRLNHVGDWGTQFGMLIAHLQDEFPEYATVCPPIADLQAFYKASKKRFDEGGEFKDRAYQNVVKLQAVPPDQSIYNAWKAICTVSMVNFTNVYKQLNISPDLTLRGESYYNELMKKQTEELKRDGKLTLDEGRYILFPTGQDVPMTIIKSDGGFTYDTSDLATIKQRVDEEKSDTILYVTDAGQSLHFEQLFQAAQDLGIYSPEKVRVVHVPFGVVLGEDRKKFKTRSGDTVKLQDLLQEARERVHEVMKGPAAAGGWSDEELEKNKHAVAMSCIKYSDLSSNREKAYIFSYDKMISFTGNTGAYLCYAYTRIMSIIRKCGHELDEIQGWTNQVAVSLTGEAEERKLAKTIILWYDRINQVEQDLLTHVLCDWLYDLAKTFTEFYSKCYVIQQSKDGTSTLHKDRLILVSATAVIMKRAFKVLGFLTPDRM